MSSAASEWSEQFVIEKPILFSSAMVLALLAGRKTVTRRIVTVPWHRSTRSLPYEPYFVEDAGKLMVCCDEAEDSHGGGDFREYTTCMPAPYGRAGDRLWVRETFKVVARQAYQRSDVPHRASPDGVDWAIYRAGWERSAPKPWTSPIYMAALGFAHHA